MTYENADRYLLLKQLLVVYSLTLTGAKIKVGEIEYDTPTAVSCITQILDDIEELFTIPYGLLTNKAIYLELEDTAMAINLLCAETLEDGPLLDGVNALSDKVNLEKAIYNYPIKNIYVEMFKSNYNSGIQFHNARLIAGELVQATVLAIESIRKWIVSSNQLCLERVIILSNCAEMTDWLFSYTNDLCGANDESA